MPEPKKQKKSPIRGTNQRITTTNGKQSKHQDQVAVIFTPEQWAIVKRAIRRMEEGRDMGMTPGCALELICTLFLDRTNGEKITLEDDISF